MDYYDETGRKLDAGEYGSPVKGMVVRTSKAEVTEYVVEDGERVERKRTVVQYLPVFDAQGRSLTIAGSPLVPAALSR